SNPPPAPTAPAEWTVRCESTVEIPRGDPAWPAVDLTVAVDGERKSVVRIEAGRGTWRGTSTAQPKSIEIDPDYDVLRTIAAGVPISFGGKTYEGAEYSVLVTSARNGVPYTLFLANSKEAAARARYVTYYGWDQYVIFKAGRRTPVARGFLDREPKGTRRAVVIGDPSATNVETTIETLASDEFEGRRSGTADVRRIAKLFESRVAAAAPSAGIVTVEQ